MNGSQRPSDLSVFVSRLRRTPWSRAIRQAWRSRGRGERLLLPERLEGAVYGHLCGDALGVPYEFLPAAAIERVEWTGGGAHGQPPGTWSDDGALMLALLDSLLTVGFDTRDQAERALAWQAEGHYAPGGLVFDIGVATSQALAAVRGGTPLESAGTVEAKGNGSLMRILPLALVLRDADPGELVEKAACASRVTHGSAEAQIACALYVLVACRLLAGERERSEVLDDGCVTLRAVLSERGLPGSAEAVSPTEAVAALDEFEAWTGRAGRGRVVDSFWSAWDAFAAAGDYAAAVMAAVAYGDDTDTTAAIAGGLAGVYFGIEGIPVAWRRGLRERHLAQVLVDRLVETDRSEWDGTPWRTSRATPLRLDPLDLSGTTLGADGGAVGITFLPGKRYLGYYSGPHWRDLDSDAAALRDHGVDILLLLVEDQELHRCRVTHIEEAVPAHGMELIRHPIQDPLTPSDDGAYRRLLAGLVERVGAGATLAIACRGGLDRSGMTAACLLREAGLDADTAVDRVHAARLHTLTLPDQIRYVRAWPHA